MEKISGYNISPWWQAGNAITRGLPADSDVPPPANTAWELKAKNSSVHTDVQEINYAKVD